MDHIHVTPTKILCTFFFLFESFVIIVYRLVFSNLISFSFFILFEEIPCADLGEGAIAVHCKMVHISFVAFIQILPLSFSLSRVLSFAVVHISLNQFDLILVSFRFVFDS